METTCVKQRFETADQAMLLASHIIHINQKYGARKTAAQGGLKKGKLQTYYCYRCKAWHIGHKKKGVFKFNRDRSQKAVT